MLELLQRILVLALYPILALFFSMVLTWLCIRILPRLGYIDKPGGRHIHKRLIPRGGGIAVITAFFLALGLYSTDIRSGTESSQLFWRLFWPSLLIGALGLADDRFELKSYWKLLVQIITGGLIWYFGDHQMSLFGVPLPPLLSLGFTMGWVIIVMNAFNLIDGLDGLAAGLAVVSAVSMAFWFLLLKVQDNSAVAMLILAGACLGFLRFNFHPAKIFLGDTGSLFLGLIFAVIGLSSLDKAVTMTSLLLPLLAMGVPLFDVLLAIWRRSFRKLLNPEAGGIMDADQDHLHHRLLRATHNQSRTAMLMYLISAGFAVVALTFLLLCHSAPAAGYLVLLIAMVIVVRQLGSVELQVSAKLLENGFSKPRRGLLVNIAHPFYDLAMVTFSLCLTHLLLFQQVELQYYLCSLVSVMLALFLGHNYRVYWLRAGVRDYWNLGFSIVIGSVVAVIFSYLLYERTHLAENTVPYPFLLLVLLFTLLNLVLILLERFMLHYAESFWMRHISQQNDPDSESPRILIYGGGLRCRLFLNTLYCMNQRSYFPAEVVGLVDDASAFRHLHLYGFPVLGKVRDLEAIYRDHPFDWLVLTTTPVPARRQILDDFCRKHSVKLQIFEINLQDETPENN